MGPLSANVMAQMLVYGFTLYCRRTTSIFPRVSLREVTMFPSARRAACATVRSIRLLPPIGLVLLGRVKPRCCKY